MKPPRRPRRCRSAIPLSLAVAAVLSPVASALSQSAAPILRLPSLVADTENFQAAPLRMARRLPPPPLPQPPVEAQQPPTETQPPPEPQPPTETQPATELLPTSEEPLPPTAELVEPLPMPAVVESPPAVVSTTVSPVAGFGFCDYCGQGCSSGSCCADCDSAGRFGRFGMAVYRGLCCPDPCYKPVWTPLADSAFFTTAVRPMNQQRFRWDFAEDLTRPDRAEYFWARTTDSGKGPRPSPFAIDYDELSHYIEVAQGCFGASFEYRYRSLDADGAHAAGFGDLTIGTKTLLFDTSLVQFAFQFLTHVPAGVANEGLGVGHVSLEPGAVLGFNLTPNSFLQAELNQWIPLGGDRDHAGAIFRYNLAYNHVLARLMPGVPVIGVMEMNGWRFQDGAYTDVTLVPQFQPASGESYVHGAAGVRMFFCDRADMGVSYSTPVTSNGWAETWIRSELRIRY
jgi:hypothetical protein